MKIYIASHWNNKSGAKRLSVKISQFFPEHQLTSDWIYQEETTSEKLLRRHAIRDLSNIDAADLVVVLADVPPLVDSGGMWFEMGYAVARAKAVCFIGDVKGLFPLLPQVRRFENEEDFLEEIFQ